MAVLINLLPDVKQQRLHAQRRKRNMVFAALAVMALGVAMPLITGLVLGGQQILLVNARNNNQKGVEELNATEGLNEAITAQKQLNSIYGKRDSGQDFSKFFSTLEKAVAPASQLTALEITEGGSLKMSGVAKDVDALNVLVQSLSNYTPQGLNLNKFDVSRQPFFSSINVTEIDPEGNTGTLFTIEAIFDFDLLAEAKAATDTTEEPTEKPVDLFEEATN